MEHPLIDRNSYYKTLNLHQGGPTSLTWDTDIYL